MIDNLPDVLAGKAPPPAGERFQIKVNAGMTQHVRDYLDTYTDTAPVNVPQIVKYLQAKGARGQYRNLYSAVHVILRKESGASKRLEYVKGKGFIKTTSGVGETAT